MEIKLSYKEIKTQHPDIVDILVGKIRASNSREKDKSEKDYGVTSKGMSFDYKEKDKSFSEIINNKLNSVIGLSLTISAGKTKRYVALSDKPKLFVEKFSQIHKKDIEQSKEEQERFSKLIVDEKVDLKVKNDSVKQMLPEEIEYNTDDILDKIGKVGLQGLTDGERNFLGQKK
jgi:predicted transcriptional regulator